MKFKIGILDKYIIKKFLGTFVFIITLMLSIIIVFDISEKIDDFIESHAPVGAIIFDYYMNFVPFYGNMLMSFFIFITVIFFTSKLASDTEIIAILSSGVSFNRLLVPYLISAAILAIFSFILGAFVIPPANAVRLEFEGKYVDATYYYSAQNVHKQIEPGVFVYFKSFDNQRNIGTNFSSEKFVDGKLESKLIAKQIRWDSIRSTWVISDYRIRYMMEGMEALEFGIEMDTAINISVEDFSRKDKDVTSLNANQLDDFIDKQRERGDDNLNVYLVEKYSRIAFPFSAFILTVIGLSLSSKKKRGGTGLNIGIGIGLSFTYILFLQISTQFAISSSFPAIVAIWLPNIVFSIVAFFLYLKAIR